MSRRKGEVTGHMNEREFPHLVESASPMPPLLMPFTSASAASA
jgi:hypothetical protein